MIEEIFVLMALRRAFCGEDLATVGFELLKYSGLGRWSTNDISIKEGWGAVKGGGGRVGRNVTLGGKRKKEDDDVGREEMGGWGGDEE